MELEKINFNEIFMVARIANFSFYASRKVCKLIEKNNNPIKLSILEKLRTEKYRDLIQSEIILFAGNHVKRFLESHSLDYSEWIKALSIAWSEIVYRYRPEITEKDLKEVFILRSASFVYASGFTDPEESSLSMIQYKAQVFADVIETGKLSYYSLIPIFEYKQFDDQHNNKRESTLIDVIQQAIGITFSDGKFETLLDDIEFA